MLFRGTHGLKKLEQDLAEAQAGHAQDELGLHRFLPFRIWWKTHLTRPDTEWNMLVDEGLRSQFIPAIHLKARQVMMREMLPPHNRDHVIMTWNAGTDYKIGEERQQMQAALAWTAAIFASCRSIEALETTYLQYFPEGSHSVFHADRPACAPHGTAKPTSP